MSSDDRDVDELPPERQARRTRTDRMTSRGADDDPLARRRANSRRRPTQSVPFSGPEFALWLQHGGWRFVLAVAMLLVFFIAFMIFGQPPSAPAIGTQPTRAPLQIQTPVATVTAVSGLTMNPTAPISATIAAPGQQARFRVTGTGTEGLFLRPQPSSEGAPLKTLPEGTEVTIIGEDSVQADRVWKHIRDAAGAEGWGAADFLQPVQ